MSKESKTKQESKPVTKPDTTPKLLPRATTSSCPKCHWKNYVEEHGMPGTKHCPDCGHWEGLKEWAEAHK